MTILRCTGKLLRRLPKSLMNASQSEASADNARSSTVLGDWYATNLIVNRIHFVLAVSTHARLCVVLPGRDKSLLVLRFRNSVESLLLDIGVPSDQVKREMEAMSPIVFDSTMGGEGYHSVLGSLNEFCYLAEPYLEEAMALRRLAMELSRTPCTPLKMAYPFQVALSLLEAADPGQGTEER